MPVASELLPTPNIVAPRGDHDVLASPEWFGDGVQSFRQQPLAGGTDRVGRRERLHCPPWAAGNDTNP